MYPTLSLGPLTIPTAPLTIIIGLWLLLDVIERAARQRRLESKLTYNLAVTALAAGFVGARLAFVALHWSAYRDNLWGMVWPLTSGYEVWAGLVVGIFAALLVVRRHQLPLWPTLDALAPGLWVGFMAISLADFLGGPGYGKPTTVFWGIELFSLRRHPVQVYELLAGVVALWLWRRLARQNQPAGTLFLGSAAAYSALRLFVDAYRDNAPITNEGYHITQLIAFAVMLGSLFLITRLPVQVPAEDSV
jgi:phosphatidylglycerol:prolipoprotein diacylglycerol transferase